MKKLTGNKFGLVFALMVAILVGSFGFGNEKASANSFDTFWWYHGGHPSLLQHNLDVRDNGSSVDVSLTQHNGQTGGSCNGCVFNWKMELLRETGGYNVWTVIGTRTGYVESISPSHRTFTGIGYLDSRIRVKITVGSDVYWSKPYYR